jgi:hypothetical protein
MNNKFRLQPEIKGYIFQGYPNLTWHSGKFWNNDIPCKVIYNNGSLSILLNGAKISIDKLRKAAKECTFNISQLPF